MHGITSPLVAFMCMVTLCPFALSAQQSVEVQSPCVSSRAEPEAGACTDAINSGRLSGVELAAAYFHRGNVWADRKQFERAIADYDAALAITPGSSEALNNRGSAWRARGDDNRALADFTRSIEINPRYILALRNRAAVWRSLGQPERAEIDEAVAFDLAFRKAAAEMLARSRKEVEDAISEANAALERNPRDIDAYMKRGLAWRKWGESGKAIADFTAALAVNPSHVGALVSRGDAQLSPRKFDDAIVDYDAALQQDPSNVDAHVGRGQAYLSKGEPRRAIADFDEALRVDPTLKLAIMHRGNAWLAAGEPSRAVTDYSVGVKTYPDWTTVRRLRGFAYFVAGEFALAQADFEELSRTTAFNTGDTTLALWLYLVRARLGADARAALLKDSNLQTSAVAWPGPVAALYAGRSQADKVQDYLEGPYTLKWQRCEGHYYLGEWNLLQNQLEPARAWFQRALESCVGHFVQYAAVARAELARMKR